MEYEYELVHHGIKGQRWGVRRFQNKSGGLTSAGRKRYGVGKESSSSTKKTESTNSKKSAHSVHEDYIKAHSKKPVSSLSDQELRAINNRLQAEKLYESLNPKKKSIGRKFLDEFVMPAAKDIGKEYVKKYMKEGVSYIEGFSNNKTNNDSNNNNSNNKTKNNSTNKNDDFNSNNKSSFKNRTKTERETYEGPINIKGEGTSKRSSGNANRNSTNHKKIYTDAWSEVRETFSSAPSFNDTMTVFKGMTSKMSNYAPEASMGQAFISGLLEPPKS